MKRENKLTIKTVVSLVVLLLWMATPSFGESNNNNSPPTEDVDQWAKNYAQSVLEAIEKQHIYNQYLNRIGKAAEVNFIIDMRNYFNNPQHPELNSQPFVSPSVKQELNQQINAYYHTYRHPFYIILSPIYARALDNSIGNKLFNSDVLDFDETQVWATFRERYRSYLQKLTEQKHGLFPAALEGRISDGAVLDIESQIFYKLIDRNYQISFDVSLLLSQTVDKSNLIEDYYNKKIQANPAAFRITYRHEPALQSYVQTITDAFKTYYSPYREPQNLSEQMTANLRTLSLPVYVMVKTNGYRLLREEADRLYLDQWDQTFYDLYLGTGGGKQYFNIDQEGYVDATAMQGEAMQANAVTALPQLARTVRDVLVSTKLILDIVRVVDGAYLENNRPITEVLEADARQGTFSGTELIRKASAARSKLYNQLQNGHYSGDELRARLLMLFDLTETLKKVFAPDSRYPFQRLTLAQIKVQAVTDSKVAPTDPEKSLLDYLESRIARGETLPAEEQVEYLRLLCKLKNDCREENGKETSHRKLITRALEASSDDDIISQVMAFRSKLPSDYKKSGNVAIAFAKISILNKTDYYAHSSIDELTPTLVERALDVSLKPIVEIFPWTSEPNKAGDLIPRNIDTEYKILTEIAGRLGDNTNVSGKIKLFTELEPCKSCSAMIKLFSIKYPNIEVEVVHNSGNRLIEVKK